jgi:excinuclease ABC subunit A
MDRCRPVSCGVDEENRHAIRCRNRHHGPPPDHERVTLRFGMEARGERIRHNHARAMHLAHPDCGRRRLALAIPKTGCQPGPTPPFARNRACALAAYAFLRAYHRVLRSRECPRSGCLHRARGDEGIFNSPTLKNAIKISGARTHNLKAIRCSFPSHQITVVTGVSGSGKSSLVFDTLYAEGQRRYVQSLSTYARLFLQQMERPDVDEISDIPPAIALEQKNSIKNARSTVGTITEVHDYLRLLMTHAGEPTCMICGASVGSDTIDSAAGQLLSGLSGSRVVLYTAVELHGLETAEAMEALKSQGYGRLMLDGEAVPIADVEPKSIPGGPLEVVVDRMTVALDREARLREALESGFRLGSGRVFVREVDGKGQPRVFDQRFGCRTCDREYMRPTPHLFSFNNAMGACPECTGFGRVVDIDLDKVIPNKRLSLKDGAIAPWNTPAFAEVKEDFLRAAERRGYSTGLPYSQLPAAAKEWILSGDREALGIRGFFQWLEGRRYKTHVRILLARYRTYRTCPKCDGCRLRPEALSVRVDGRNIAELCALSIGDLAAVIDSLNLPSVTMERSNVVLNQIRNRLAYLLDVGLGYLTLDRQARTLSGGEAQRIHLAAALGSALTDTLYALDEPTVGLHPRDSKRLLRVLRRLTDVGNTVVLVEHDPTIISGADHLIDLGPGGGERGGEVVYEGKPENVDTGRSSTGRLLMIRSIHRQDRHSRKSRAPKLVIKGAKEHNLSIDRLEIPLHRLVCVTGVSGSGKSTLVEDVIYGNYLKESGLATQDAGACDEIRGFDQLSEVLMMGQAPIGRSLRSNAVTYLKCYDEIRRCFAGTSTAKRAKLTAASFSFNTAGGRCERCQGTGSVTIEMHFMADIEVKCEECDGRRFKRHVLDVSYRERSIYEVLEMTVDTALEFFADRPVLKSKLACLQAVGLGYIRLGQSTSTLSGGEAQRLKLAGFLGEETRKAGALFLFDEPTTGLHLQDVHTLISVLDGLVQRGHSVLVVEHHTDFIAHADHVIDLGPEGGRGGGRIVAQGTPLEVAEFPDSHTGKELRAVLGLGTGQ